MNTAILRTNIDAWLVREAMFTKYLPELGGIIGGEKHVVAIEIEAAGGCGHHGDEGGQRAFVGFDAGDGAG